jgi:hypothetical protein
LPSSATSTASWAAASARSRSPAAIATFARPYLRSGRVDDRGQPAGELVGERVDDRGGAVARRPGQPRIDA